MLTVGLPVAVLAAGAGSVWAAMLAPPADAQPPPSNRVPGGVAARTAPALVVVSLLLVALLLVQGFGDLPTEPLGGGGVRERLLGLGRPLTLLAVGVGLMLIVAWRWDEAALSDRGWLGLGLATLEEMTDEVIGVLTLCEDLYDDTAGAFDAWMVPAPNGSHLDPSGVVKGWSIERAAEILERHGARNFCINAGGDIVVRGHVSGAEPWRIGIRHPSEGDKSAAVVEAAGRLAIATSATYERGAHIIDPATGEPTADVASVTIVGPDLTFVDAYATAVFVMGLDGLTWLAERHPDHAGFVITHDGRAVSTANFDQHRAG
jgi:thiamine biosynthesis lipoprotein